MPYIWLRFLSGLPYILTLFGSHHSQSSRLLYLQGRVTHLPVVNIPIYIPLFLNYLSLYYFPDILSAIMQLNSV